MRSAIFVVPVWLLAFAAIWAGISRNGSDVGTAYVVVGILGVCVANVFMLQHRRIAELERSLALLAGSDT